MYRLRQLTYNSRLVNSLLVFVAFVKPLFSVRSKCARERHRNIDIVRLNSDFLEDLYHISSLIYAVVHRH